MSSPESDKADFSELEIEQLREEVEQLRLVLADKERRLHQLEAKSKCIDDNNESGSVFYGESRLSNEEIARYSRQLILPDFGLAGQLKLRNSRVLIVGMGGLGCPAAQYLAAAGCSCLGLVDYDSVERSNFHRQTLHTKGNIGMTKVDSAQKALTEMNPNCKTIKYNVLLNSGNAFQIIGPYDVILDCTDNVPTRYLLNDACVMLHKPLVSGSALQLDGQLTVYHYGEMCPCYRCLFPMPPPPSAVTNCGDGGVLGAVTGVIGSLQAMEAIKIIVELGNVLAGRMLIFDGMRCTFRNIKLRSRRTDCDVCSTKSIITHLIDYEQFCSMHASDKNSGLDLLTQEQRISVRKYQELQSKPHLLIDVRSPAEFEICHLPRAENVPLKQVLDNSYIERFTTQLENENLPIVLVCRRGNDSQIAVQHMINKFPKNSIQDVIGGLHAWHRKIDPRFPIY